MIQKMKNKKIFVKEIFLKNKIEHILRSKPVMSS